MSLGMNPKTTPPWILTGWLLSATLLFPHTPRALPLRIVSKTPENELFKRGSVRELCVIPGLGARRAQSLVSSRSTKGILPPFEDIPGIGPKTAETLRSFRDRGLSVPGVTGLRRQRLSATHGGE
jgi:hypothetical protein